MDNLESQTYEVFEKDPIKYSLYQQAVYAALTDRVPEAEKDTRTTWVSILSWLSSLLLHNAAIIHGFTYPLWGNSSGALLYLIGQHLSWKDHVTLISKKISKNIGIIARIIKYCLSTQNLLNLYCTLIIPYLPYLFFYCNIVWGCNYKSSLNHLYILQKG